MVLPENAYFLLINPSFTIYMEKVMTNDSSIDPWISVFPKGTPEDITYLL